MALSLDDIRRSRPLHVTARPYRPPMPKRVRRARGFLPVIGTGAVGDLVVTVGVLERLSAVEGPLRFWCPYPDVADMLMTTDWAGGVVSVEREPYPGFDRVLVLNSLARFEFHPSFRGEAGGMRNQDSFWAWTRLRWDRRWAAVIDNHPGLDGEAARLAVEMGWSRATLPYHMLGLEPQDRRVRLSAGPYDWEPFITVHDGVDATQTGIRRPTKTWNIRHWREFVARFKESYPGYLVVQIGGPTSREIPGVDVNLVGRTTLPEALRVLSRSALHVDGESGFVHAAHLFGVRSVVVFGPTPVDFFGYPDNVNLAPRECGGCFWLRDDWLARCPLGHDVPKCMDSVLPEVVASSAARVLKGAI